MSLYRFCHSIGGGLGFFPVHILKVEAIHLFLLDGICIQLPRRLFHSLRFKGGYVYADGGIVLEMMITFYGLMHCFHGVCAEPVFHEADLRTRSHDGQLVFGALRQHGLNVSLGARWLSDHTIMFPIRVLPQLWLWIGVFIVKLWNLLVWSLESRVILAYIWCIDGSIHLSEYFDVFDFVRSLNLIEIVEAVLVKTQLDRHLPIVDVGFLLLIVLIDITKHFVETDEVILSDGNFRFLAPVFEVEEWDVATIVRIDGLQCSVDIFPLVS